MNEYQLCVSLVTGFYFRKRRLLENTAILVTDGGKVSFLSKGGFKEVSRVSLQSEIFFSTTPAHGKPSQNKKKTLLPSSDYFFN